jgi:hypothetical protein
VAGCFKDDNNVSGSIKSWEFDVTQQPLSSQLNNRDRELISREDTAKLILCERFWTFHRNVISPLSTVKRSAVFRNDWIRCHIPLPKYRCDRLKCRNLGNYVRPCSRREIRTPTPCVQVFKTAGIFHYCRCCRHFLKQAQLEMQSALRPVGRLQYNVYSSATKSCSRFVRFALHQH